MAKRLVAREFSIGGRRFANNVSNGADTYATSSRHSFLVCIANLFTAIYTAIEVCIANQFGRNQP